MRRSWFGSVAKQNKSPSLELLKSLYAVLVKNAIVTDHNKTLIVEVLRSIAETVIWGDQNDPRVFDFFLEKGIQSYFLSIIEQPKCGTYVCTQLLQTMNILFENIRNETSIYFLLSNNHVNSVICHEFDFSDEEIMAYYISFVKTLSLKLNSNTIHFFYNEHLRDFPLYTEAIKFFNHPESMVRIAVRTLTLNVYRVGDEATIQFIHDKTAAPYFSNLVWFIGNNVLMMERCLRNEASHLTRNKLESLVALHLDDMHYVHDIMQLQMKTLNNMLCEHLLNTLYIPLYVYSLDPSLKVDSPQVSVKCALFLLSQVFLILSHPPLVKQLKLYICFEENPNLDSSERMRRFTKPISQIQDTLKPAVIPKNKQNLQPTRLAKEHKQELRQREEKRLREEARLKDQEKYPKRASTSFNQTGYLKSILDPDPGTDPLSGTRVHQVESLKNMETRSRESSTVSRDSSAYSEAVYIDSEDCKTESYVDLDTQNSAVTIQQEKDEVEVLTPTGRDVTIPRDDVTIPRDDVTIQRDDVTMPRGDVTIPQPLPLPDNNHDNHDYPVSEDSGIVSSETEGVEQEQEQEQEHEQEEPPSSPLLEESESTQTLSSTEQAGGSDLSRDLSRDDTPEFKSPVSESPTPNCTTPDNGNDNTITLSDSEVQKVNNQLTLESLPVELPQNSSSEDLLFTPPKNPDSSHHFADAFHCPPTRSCIFYDALLSCLELGEDDVEALFSTALLYAMFTNKSMPHKPPAPFYYDDRIIDRLLNLLDKACNTEGIVRLITVEIAVRLLRVLTTYENRVLLQDNHLAVLTAVKENSVRFLRNFYTGEDNTLFVELFDEEYKQFVKRRPTNIAHIMSDECMLLGTVYTPLTGIDFAKRLPCGDLEKMRKSLIVFFTIRKLWQEALGQEESELPLLNLSLQVAKGDVLNLNNSDLIACAVISDNDVAAGFASMFLNMRTTVKRFLVIDTHQLILVEPDNAPGRLGYGIVQFVAPLQSVDARPDKDNNRNLQITIEKSSVNTSTFRAKFQFEDHIRCFAAKTRLKQGRESLQKLKGFKLSHVLDMPDRTVEEPSYNPQVSITGRSYKGPLIGKSRPEKGATMTSPPRSSASSLSGSDQPPRSGSGGGTPNTPRKSLEKLPDPEVV